MGLDRNQSESRKGKDEEKASTIDAVMCKAIVDIKIGRL